MSIEVQKLSKYYQKQLALDEVSFKVNSGEIVGFLGPNGAGKSTTMKIISCFIKPSSGNVLVDGISILENEIAVKTKIGYLPENNPLYEDMYVRESIAFIAQIHKVEDVKNSVAEVIEKVGLSKEAHKKIGQLSKGYQQRVGIAQAIVHDPEVLILDEPTSGLDAAASYHVMNYIHSIAQDFNTIIICTIHQPSSFVYMRFNKVMLLSQGRLAFLGSPKRSVDYFASLGHKTPELSNPAEYLLDIINSEFTDPASVDTLLDQWHQNESAEVQVPSLTAFTRST